MTNLELKYKLLDKVMYKITALQILALLIICCAGMYMNSHNMYIEQIYLIPTYIVMLAGIIFLNKKWCQKIDNMPL